MINLSRLKGISVSIGAVLGALVLMSLLAQGTAGGRPGWLSGGDSTIEGGQDAIVGGRVAGAQAQFRDRKASDAPEMGIILGSSAVGMDLVPTLLEAGADGKTIPRRWLSLYANGANLEDLRNLSDLVFHSELKPKVLVLGIHPGLLARSDDYLSDRIGFDPTILQREWNRGNLQSARKEFETLYFVVPINRAFPNRTRVSNLVRGEVAMAKRKVFARFGLGAEALYATTTDPWTVQLLFNDEQAEGRTAIIPDLADGPMLNPQGGVKDKGWEVPGSYTLEGRNTKALTRLILDSRSRGVEPVVLLLPETTGLRGGIPPEAMQCLREALRSTGPLDPPPALIDLREAIPDAMFLDAIHLKKEGRMAATRKLADALRSRPRWKAPGGE